MEETEQTLQPVTFQLTEQVEIQQCGCVEGWTKAAGCGSSPCTLAPVIAVLCFIVKLIEYSQCFSLKVFLNNSSRVKGWEKNPKTPKKQYIVHNPSTEQRQE